MRKVRGHQDAALANLAGDSRHHALGNIAPDAAAGRGLAIHPRPTDAEQAEAALLLRIATEAKLLFASLWDAWPRIGGLAALPRLPYLPRPKSDRRVHEWHEVGDPAVYDCLRCQSLCHGGSRASGQAPSTMPRT